ncbi:MAG: hypothetical protein HWN80_05195 [Candidatus Lokiarchaeota archaeon]|nr:hypothetical protein [Candidatus Lokiarchaeota archaeon]
MEFTKDSFTAICSITDAEGKGVKDLLSHHKSALGCKTLEGFFNLIKNEALQNSDIGDNKSEFDKISEVLYQNFELENLSGNKSLEKAIEEFIAKLNRYEYYIPEELVGEQKEGLTPLGIDYYVGSFDALNSLMSNAMKSLREEKIQFWKGLLEKYRKDKEALDYEFKMSSLRTKEMKERFYKLTPEDFKDLL